MLWLQCGMMLVLALALAVLAGLTHLPRRTQMDEAVFPVKLRRRKNIRNGERRLRVYDLVDVSGWFRRRRHGGPKVCACVFRVEAGPR